MFNYLIKLLYQILKLEIFFQWQSFVLSTILGWRLNNIIKRLENVKDNNSKIRVLLLKTCCSRADPLIKSLGIGVDPRDASTLMKTKQGSCSWKATQWRE